jgi:hypothetical protein
MNPTPLMNSSIEKGRPSKHQYGTMMSRNSSREASIDPMSQRRVDGRGTIPGEDRSESEVDKSPHKAVGTRQPSQFGISHTKGKNIIDNLGDGTNHQHEIKRWNTYGARGDQSEYLDQSNYASNTTVVNHSSIPRAQKMSNFAVIKEPSQSRKEMAKNLRNRNFTCDVDRNHIVENDESEKSFDDAKAPFKRAGTVKRLTHIVSKNSQEEYKVKYLKLPVTANGSYALVEKWRLRQEDQLEFAMKFMTVTKVSDKIKSSLCLSDAEARDMAIKLCENELNVSKTLGPHPNIASIEDSYVDKAKGEYRFFSKWADLSTLLSDSHQQWLKQAQSEDLNNQEQEIMKNYFVDIVKGLQHSTFKD